MKRDLFVRGFDSELHSQISEMAAKEGVPLSSIVEDAVDRWIRYKRETSTRHVLLLYDDEESLTNVLHELERTTKDKFKVCIGPPSHFGMKFLRRYGWFDATLSPYTRLFDRPKQYFGQVREQIVSETEGTQACIMGFVTGDMCHERSLKDANVLENMYNSNRVVGTMFCPFLTEDVLRGNVEDILALVNNHDESFVLKKDKLYRFRLTEANLHKLIS